MSARSGVKRLGLVFLAAIVPALARAETPAIAWLESPREALVKSRELNRPLLVYFKGSHCGYCRRMERETWTNSRIARLVSQGYVPLALDGETHVDWMDRFAVKGFPSVVVLSTSGAVRLHQEGFLPAGELERRLTSTEQERR